MKQGHKNHLFTFILCFAAAAIIGVAIGYVKYFKIERAATTVSATVTLTYDGISEGLAPNGGKFNIASLRSEALVEKALADCGLQTRYTAAEVLRALTVRGYYSADVEQRLLSSDSRLTSEAVSNEYPSTFTFTLSDTFSTDASESDLRTILGSLMKVYDAYFAETYLYSFDTEGLNGAAALGDFDLEQQLDLIGYDLAYVRAYARELYGKTPGFRSDGMSFNDICTRIDTLQTDTVDRLSAEVSANAYHRNPEQVYQKYVYHLNSLTNELEGREENLARLNELLASYSKNETVYVVTGDSLTALSDDSSATYDELVAMRDTVAEKITQIKAEISNYKYKLNTLLAATGITEAAVTGAAADGEDADGAQTAAANREAVRTDTDAIAQIEAEIEKLAAKRDSIAEQFRAMLAAYNNTYLAGVSFSAAALTCTAPKLLSGGFAGMLVKCCGPLCLLAVMVWTACRFVQSGKRKED